MFTEETLLNAYKEDGEEPTTMTIYPSILNKCIKKLGGKFTLNDLEKKYTNFKPKLPLKKISSMSLDQVQHFARVFAFTAPAQNRLTLPQARKQVREFLTYFPEFNAGSIEVIVNLMSIRLEALKAKYGISYGESVKINQFPEYGGMFIVQNSSNSLPFIFHKWVSPRRNV